MQNSLAELGLVNVLNDMFDKLDWVPTPSRAHSRGIHGLGCVCNPKSVRTSSPTYERDMLTLRKQIASKMFDVVYQLELDLAEVDLRRFGLFLERVLDYIYNCKLC